jgi:hypothetical protein
MESQDFRRNSEKELIFFSKPLSLIHHMPLLIQG